ncbi:MAG: hypothetical protein GXN92_02755 [Candidatus Micrarchaeota archaeon]|nr:hypothetical protein [Candidatus Micrarchaeota archaeon]
MVHRSPRVTLVSEIHVKPVQKKVLKEVVDRRKDREVALLLEGYSPTWLKYDLSQQFPPEKLVEFLLPEKEREDKFRKVSQKLRQLMTGVKVDGLDVPTVYDVIHQWKTGIYVPPPEGNELYARAIRLYMRGLQRYLTSLPTHVLIEAFQHPYPRIPLYVYERKRNNLTTSPLTRVDNVYRSVFFAGAILETLKHYNEVYAWMGSAHSPLVKGLLEDRGISVEEIGYKGRSYDRKFIARNGELKEEKIPPDIEKIATETAELADTLEEI